MVHNHTLEYDCILTWPQAKLKKNSVSPPNADIGKVSIKTVCAASLGAMWLMV